jgi:hypothetical protein
MVGLGSMTNQALFRKVAVLAVTYGSYGVER